AVGDPDGFRLPQDVLQLACPERGIRRDEDQAGHRRAVLQDDPLRIVGRPDDDAVAGREPAEQPMRRAPCILEELGIRPRARLRLWRESDQRAALTAVPSRLDEYVSGGQV